MCNQLLLTYHISSKIETAKDVTACIQMPRVIDRRLGKLFKINKGSDTHTHTINKNTYLCARQTHTHTHTHTHWPHSQALSKKSGKGPGSVSVYFLSTIASQNFEEPIKLWNETTWNVIPSHVHKALGTRLHTHTHTHTYMYTLYVYTPLTQL